MAGVRLMRSQKFGAASSPANRSIQQGRRSKTIAPRQQQQQLNQLRSSIKKQFAGDCSQVSGANKSRVVRSCLESMRKQQRQAAASHEMGSSANQQENKDNLATMMIVGLVGAESGAKNKRLISIRSRWPSALLFAVGCCLALLLSLTSGASADVAGKTTQAVEGAPTSAYGEPIKWSFGGWAPLDGKMPPNGTVKGHQQQPIGATSPLPGATNNLRPTGRPNQAPRVSNRQQQAPEGEALKEAGSISHGEKVHYGGQWDQSSPDPQQYRQQQQQMKLHSGPAYAMPMQRPQEFSPPAPAPIVRDQLLPSPGYNQAAQMNHHHQFQQRPQQHRPAAPYMPPNHHHQMRPVDSRRPQHNMHQPMMHQHQRPRMHPNQMHSADFYRQQQEQQQKYHQQQIRQQQMKHEMMHQQMMQQFQQQAAERPTQPAHSAGSAYRPTLMDPPTSAQRAHQQQRHLQQVSMEAVQQQMARQPEASQPPRVGSYKVIEGEQPVMFTSSLSGHDRIPVLEVNGRANKNSSSEHSSPTGGMTHTHQQQQQVAGEQAGGDYTNSPTLAAIEKDNLNYHNALNQVANYQAADEQQQQQQPQSNNIQDIKQKQLYNDQQQRQQPATNELSQADKAKSSYLTIPVAVETEGDKVLTADDINEIEKHVINVLPTLKTADKIVKMADAHLTLAPVHQQKTETGAPGEQQPLMNAMVEPEMHQIHYDEHRTTMKQLEGDLKELQQTSQPPSDYHTSAQPQHHSEHPSTVPATSYGPSTVTMLTTGGTHTAPESHSSERPSTSSPAASTRPQQQQQQQQHHDDGPSLEHQYFVATGPAQELGTFDPDQIADYNLIKDDLLNNFRYEPTRAQPGSQPSRQSKQQQQQTASTQPMPYHPSGPIASSQPHRNPSPATVTRYFQQGQPQSYNTNQNQHRQQQQQQRGRGLFGRLNGHMPSTASPAGSTKTTLGGRKVSEVMRPLIHTTPVPMTSPIHMPSVEPEKVDAIQLIAGNGQANDKRPMVVEAHQLVNHTPDGGIDYNSGASAMNPANHQPPQHQSSGNQTYAAPDQNQGAIIEYVAINEQTMNNAVNQPATSGQQQYEIAGQQEAQPMYISADQLPSTRQPGNMYDYTMTTQHQASPVVHTDPQQQQQQQQQQQMDEQQSPTPPTTTYLVSGLSNHQEPQLAAWSPSVAREHQRQQKELSEHAQPAGPMQQMDMPATAGYNFFNQQQEQPTASSGQPPVQQEYEQQQQQQQEQEQDQQQPQAGARWRTKAGGSQPSADAQYDGQIVKGAQEVEADNNEQQQQQQQANADDNRQYGQQSNYNNHQQADLSRMIQTTDSRPQEEQPEHEQQHGDNGNNEATAADDYQQQQQQQQRYQDQTVATTPAGGEPTSQQQQQQQQDGYVTNSFVGGAQMNHRPTPHEQSAYDQQQQYGYMKLDRDRQQTHLAKHQAQHQARLAEMMNQQNQYQTTTPMSLTTMPAIEQQQEMTQQQQAVNEQQEGQLQQQLNAGSGASGSTNNGQYMVEQVQSRPSVQSSPDSMLVNGEPVQYPIMDQQSLISDPSQESSDEFGSDDRAAAGKQSQQSSQPAGVYQVYQAYYAPKDHKPLPGYVRLSLEEFHDLFRDAEIQYVDKNLNGINNLVASQQATDSTATNAGYDRAESMNAASSEQQSILVDRRSISERRSWNSSVAETDDEDKSAHSRGKPQSDNKKSKISGQTVKKIISIRNSRQEAKQTTKPSSSSKKSSSSAASVPSTSTTSSVVSGESTGTTKSLLVGKVAQVNEAAGKPMKHTQAPSKRKTDLPLKKANTQQQLNKQSKITNEQSQATTKTTLERTTVAHKASVKEKTN